MRTPIPALVAASAARPWRTALLCLILAALGVAFAATHFRMTTDTAELISPDVGLARQERAMDAAFPQLRDAMLVVVDGATPELAEDGAAERLGEDVCGPSHFRAVRRPDGGDFFAREGLLFGSGRGCATRPATLIQAQPLLGPLAADPSLRGVAGGDRDDARGRRRAARRRSADVAPRRCARWRDAIDARLAGKPAAFSWQRLFARRRPAAADPPADPRPAGARLSAR